MSNMDWKEVEAASVEEATREALEQLGAREDEVTIEVIATPRAGVLGLGARQARVRVTRKGAADVDVNPPSDEQVDTTPLFDSSTNTCYDPGSFGPQHSRS